MAQSSNSTPRQGGGGAFALLVAALGLTAGYYAALWHYVPADSLLVRYTAGHWVEYIEVGLFIWGLLLLAAMGWRLARERRALRYKLLGAEQAGQVSPESAPELVQSLESLPRAVRGSLLVDRVRSGLEFVAHRGTADGLDEHLRSQSDADANAIEGGHSLIKFIIWAIPILGFLGTVLGITNAIANVTPEQLANSISGVTDGLAVAFDTTAVALMFSMCHMFLNFVVDRGEQTLLRAIDEYVAERIAHRFERSAGATDAAQWSETRRQVLSATESLVRQQAEIWQQSLHEVQKRANVHDRLRQEQLASGLAEMLERTLTAHERRLLEMEKKVRQETLHVVPAFEKIHDALVTLAGVVDQQAQRTAEQAQLLGRLLDGERQILRLQETLNLTLQSLSSAGTFQHALHSLTAAIHLLTAGACGTAATPVPSVPAPAAMRNIKGQAA